MDPTVSLGSFGKDLGLIQQLVLTGLKLGADAEFYAKLAHNPVLFQRVIEIVKADTTRYSTKLAYISPPLRLFPDYKKKLQTQSSQYNIRSISNIVDNPGLGSVARPRATQAEVSAKLIRIVSPELLAEVSQIIRDAGMRPANIWELLSFGRLFPMELIHRKIVALGTVLQTDDSNYVRSFFPAIGNDLFVLSLFLDWQLKHANRVTHFLVVDI